MAGREKIGEILDDLEEKVERTEDVTVEEVVEHLGHRGFGPLIAVPALLAASPLGGIPGVPSAMALIIALMSVQLLMHRRHLWVPDFIGHRSVPDEKMCTAIEKLRGIAHWIDTHFGNRMAWATRDPVPKIAAGFIVLLCLAVPFVELLPFAAVVPLGAIAMIGLALTLHDGALLFFAVAIVAAGAVGLLVYISS